MNSTQRETLRALLRRVDEVRGLSEDTGSPSVTEPVNADALLQTLAELVQELERSHRRLIETNVQLVSLREVASSTVSTLDGGEITRLVTRYLCRAFGFEQGFLLLINRETGRLEGSGRTPWPRRRCGSLRCRRTTAPTAARASPADRGRGSCGSG